MQARIFGIFQGRIWAIKTKDLATETRKSPRNSKETIRMVERSFVFGGSEDCQADCGGADDDASADHEPVSIVSHPDNDHDHPGEPNAEKPLQYFHASPLFSFLI
jgi:hypothetical protein